MPETVRSKSNRLDRRSIRTLRALLDFYAVLVAFWLTFYLRIWAVDLGVVDAQALDVAPYLDLALGFGAVVVAIFWRVGLYREHASVLGLSELQSAVKGVILAAALFLALLFLLNVTNFSRFVVFGGFIVSMMLVLLERRLVAALIRRVQFSGRIGRRNVLIYGSAETGKLLMKKILQAPHKACRVVGFLDDFAPLGATIRCRVHQTTMATHEAHVLGRLHDLKRIAQEHEVHELLVTVSLTNAERHHELIGLAREAGVEVGVVPRFGDFRADQIEVEDLSAVTVLRPSPPAMERRFYPAFKRAFDVGVGFGLLVVMAPIGILASLLIRLESEGPIFFRQTRVGMGGKPFRIFKFRTMRRDVDPYASSPIGDLSDARITRVGRLLRMAGFDELPQILNVLRGEMSLVGPRPEMPFIADRYTSHERQRLLAKPGITGIWQLSCDRHAEIHENLEYDLYYIRHQSILLDVLVLLETVFFTVGLVGSLADPEVRRLRAVGLARTAAETPDGDESAVASGYALVALDQRRDEHLPESWLTSAPALHVLAARGNLKLLVAPDNVAAFDRLMHSGPSGNGGPDAGAQYVPYVDRSQLRAMTLGAGLVLTDLPHVCRWAEEGQVDLLVLDGDRLLWYNRSRGRDEVIAAIAERLAVVGMNDEALPPMAEPASHGLSRIV